MHIMVVVNVCELIGMKIAVTGRGELTCKTHLLFALADLPAKASLINITQCNGKYGCPSCKHEGEQVRGSDMLLTLLRQS